MEELEREEEGRRRGWGFEDRRGLEGGSGGRRGRGVGGRGGGGRKEEGWEVRGKGGGLRGGGGRRNGKEKRRTGRREKEEWEGEEERNISSLMESSHAERHTQLPWQQLL